MKGLAFALVVLLTSPACGGEMVLCSIKPGKGPFVYREPVEGINKRCWFPAQGLRRGEQKPLEELTWGRDVKPASFVDRFWRDFEEKGGWLDRK